MLELAEVRRRAKLIGDVREDIKPVVKRLIAVKGLEELDTDSHRRRWRPNQNTDEGNW